jgi:hypothetical protein
MECPSEVAACSAECVYLTECIAACTTDACVEACADGATAQAAEEFLALLSCYDVYCSEAGTDQAAP